MSQLSVEGKTRIPDPENHLTCYSIKQGPPSFSPREVTVSDQFISPAKSFSVIKAKRLCVPVDKNGEGIVNGSRKLLCYKAKPVSPTIMPTSATWL